jgi:hypothetical protein
LFAICDDSFDLVSQLLDMNLKSIESNALLVIQAISGLLFGLTFFLYPTSPTQYGDATRPGGTGCRQAGLDLSYAVKFSEAQTLEAQAAWSSVLLIFQHISSEGEGTHLGGVEPGMAGAKVTLPDTERHQLKTHKDPERKRTKFDDRRAFRMVRSNPISDEVKLYYS